MCVLLIFLLIFSGKKEETKILLILTCTWNMRSPFFGAL